MKKHISYIALVLIILFAALNAFANKLPPKQSKVLHSISSSMKITVDANTKEAKLIVPKQTWERMKAEIDGTDSLNAAGRINLSPLQTLMSGVFLSLAIVFAGVWLVRRKETNKVVIGIVLFALCAVAVTSVSFANIPPPHVTTLKSNFLSEEAKKSGASGTITIEVVDGYESNLTLVLPDVPK